MPLRHRHEYAADLPRGLLTGLSIPASESPVPGSGRMCAADRPRSARFESARRLRSFTHWFLSYTFSSRSPNPRRLAVPTRPGFVRTASALTGVPRISRVGPADCSAGPPSELLGRLSPQAAQASREGGAGSKRWLLRWRVRSSLRQEACTRRVWSPSGGPGLRWWTR
jgi:hypothetical protein